MSNRIDIGDLKSQITKRVGPDCAQQYFGYLNRLLSQKLSKHDFDKLCILTLGRENLPLHNQLIRAILKNACQAKTPPRKVVQKNVFSIGDVLPPSPKRSRSDNRKIKDYFPYPLVPNGRTSEFLPPHNEVIVRENGDLGSCDLKRPVQNQEDELAEQLVKRSRIAEESTMGLVKLVDVDTEWEDFEQRNNLKPAAKVLVQAPLGIPLCLPSVGGARMPLTFTASAGFGNFISGFESGEMCHSEDLLRWMEKIAGSEGLGGVTVDCANLLNKGLDAYLKRLIESCSELVGARSGRGQIKQPVFKHPDGKPINGVWQGNRMHVQSSGMYLDGVHELTNCRPISLQDFRVAMELNPRQLGEGWPLLLEKICLRSFEE